VTNILDFVWRMCVLYHRLNQVILPFEYPTVSLVAMTPLTTLATPPVAYFSLVLTTRQVITKSMCVLPIKRNLPSSLPKYCFSIIPFGPRNAPSFYTCMMGIFQDKWNALFRSCHPLDTSHHGSRIIIDNILLWSTVLATLLAYFTCVCDIVLKYCVTFQLKKCEFLTNRIEYVGHDITPDGNCPAASTKFDLITDWPLPINGQSLASFIGLLTFYNIYCPFFEIRVKPLRALERQHHRKPIPVDQWTGPLLHLWDELKLAITSSPCLARYDSSKPCFLKTDWAGLGMGWILMQPDDSGASKVALALLCSDGICNFDVTISGARLRPICFGSRSCTEHERHYHSFVGEAGCGGWSISQNRKFLWGSEFFWLCDCSPSRKF
jgi:hypothetical protein